MTIREKVAQEIRKFGLGLPDDLIAAAAITAFLEAAAEEGWHMQPDEATEEMVKTPRYGIGARNIYRALLSAAPEFEWDK